MPGKHEKITLIDNTPIQIINGIDHVTINIPREDIPVAVFPHEGTVQWGAEYSVNVAFAPRKVEECDGKLQVGAAVIDQRVDGTGHDSTTATIKTAKGNENPPTSPTAKSAGKKVRNGTASAGTKPQPTLSTSVKKQPKKTDVLQDNTHIIYRIPCRVSVRVRDFVKKRIKPAVSNDKYYPKESLIYLELSGMVGKPSFELTDWREQLEFDITPLNYQVVKTLGVKNLTSDAINIKLSKPGPPFSIINQIETIPAADTVNLSVIYEPKTEGSVEDYLEITTVPTQTRLNLTGISYKPSVLFEPLTLESYDFGDILVNDTDPATRFR
ncbi:hypothetical protein BKA69DRAFT_1075774 [Paraphysoderma sedebokerense]|nr:hypothetical protein BKA69DRAFT_1075774 [Paraphysoderma sedebokerense]